jgi:hypothetical protein
MYRMIVLALVRETLNRAGWTVLAVLALCFSFLPVLGLLAPALPDGFKDGTQFQQVLQFSSLPAVVMFLLILAAGVSSWPLSRLYTKPLSNAALASWQVASGCLLITLTLPLVLWSYNVVFNAHWPLLSTWLFAVGLWVVCQPFFLIGTRSLGKLLVCSAPIVLMCWWYLARHGLLSRNRELVTSLHSAEIAGIFLVVAIFSWITWRIVAQDRCGESQRAAGWRLRWLAVLEPLWHRSLGSLRPNFRSPRAAQFWYLWRWRGWSLPLSVLVISIILLAANSLQRGSLLAGVSETLAGLPGLMVGFVFVLAMIGLLFGVDQDKLVFSGLRKERNNSFDQADRIGGFAGSLPITDRDLAAMQLLVCAVSITVTAVPLAALIYASQTNLPRSGNLNLARELPWQWLPLMLGVWWLAASNAMTIVCTGRTRHWLQGLSCYIVAPAILLMIVSLWVSEANMGAIFAGMGMLAMMISLLAAMMCFGLALHRGLIGWFSILLGASLPIAAVLLAGPLLEGAPTKDWCWLFTGAALCSLPLAATPLAIAANRHR